MPVDSTGLEQVISWSSVSCLINTEPLGLLRLQLSEPIASERETKFGIQLGIPISMGINLGECAKVVHDFLGYPKHCV